MSAIYTTVLVIVNKTRLLFVIHGFEIRDLIVIEKPEVLERTMLNLTVFAIRFHKIAEVGVRGTFCIRDYFNKHKASFLYYDNTSIIVIIQHI